MGVVEHSKKFILNHPVQHWATENFSFSCVSCRISNPWKIVIVCDQKTLVAFHTDTVNRLSMNQVKSQNYFIRVCRKTILVSHPYIVTIQCLNNIFTFQCLWIKMQLDVDMSPPASYITRLDLPHLTFDPRDLWCLNMIFGLVTFGLVTDRQPDRQTESDVYMHRWAQ